MNMAPVGKRESRAPTFDLKFGHAGISEVSSAGTHRPKVAILKLSAICFFEATILAFASGDGREQSKTFKGFKEPFA